MTTIIEVQEGKVQHMSEYVEKVLYYGGKLMQCVEELENKSRHSEYSSRDSRAYDKDRWEDDRHCSRYY